jgi:hypothetical protein
MALIVTRRFDISSLILRRKTSMHQTDVPTPRQIGGRRPPCSRRKIEAQSIGERSMTVILNHIRSLESYVERSGARLVRSTLPEWVQGRMISGLITLRADLNPEQQLLTLVHELAHWLAHRDVGPDPHCLHGTIYEYEAEAVEALVMDRLGLVRADRAPGPFEDGLPTDGLLSSSVSRVVSTARRICQALGVEQPID